MFCSICGSGILDGAKFCANCGFKVGADMDAKQELAGKSETTSFRAAYNSASQAVSRTASGAKKIGGMITAQIGDLNGDGKIDAEDFKLAAARAKQFTSSAIGEAGKIGKNAMQSDLAKEAAAGALVCAVIAVPVPVIGPVAGAVVGASMGAYKHFTKK